jgi:AAA+ ATPase superfamily predicted ATPase
VYKLTNSKLQWISAERYLFWGRTNVLGQNMLFDDRPKEERKALFDREKEIEELKKSLRHPIIVLTGIRRIGKTSVLKVFLKEIKRESLLLDARALPPNYGRREFFNLLASSLRPSLPRLGEILKSVRGIKLAGLEIEFEWRKGGTSLVELFDKLNERNLIIAIDEAQRLRGPFSEEVRNAIAHAYDYGRNLNFILTGSEVGLLYDFLGTEDPSSPLYGRYIHEVRLERFDQRESLEFLEKGFEEVGVRVPREVLDQAVRELDGIPGWLTFFGSSYLAGKRDLDAIKRAAIQLALEELKNLVKERSPRFPTVLKGIAEGRRSWTEIKRFVEEREGRTVSSSVLQNVLEALEKMSLVKDYAFLDPIYEEASKLL